MVLKLLLLEGVVLGVEVGRKWVNFELCARFFAYESASKNRFGLS